MMNNNKKIEQRMFFILGIFFLANGIILSVASISTGRFPVGFDVMSFAISIMAFCNGYLYPQFQAKDERSRVIREKGMFYSYFMLIGYLVVFMVLFQFTPFFLDGYQTVSVVAALLIATVFTSFVVVSKRI